MEPPWKEEKKGGSNFFFIDFVRNNKVLCDRSFMNKMRTLKWYRLELFSCRRCTVFILLPRSILINLFIKIYSAQNWLLRLSMGLFRCYESKTSLCSSKFNLKKNYSFWDELFGQISILTLKLKINSKNCQQTCFDPNSLKLNFVSPKSDPVRILDFSKKLTIRLF